MIIFNFQPLIFQDGGSGWSLTEQHHDKHMIMYSPNPKKNAILTSDESSNNFNFVHLYMKNTNIFYIK